MTDMDASPARNNEDTLRPPVGAAFAVARESQKLSIEAVHERLRISPRQIQALEADEFFALPEPMITRGFIRNYARLLGIDAEPILAAYQSSYPEAEPHSINLHSENIVIAGTGRNTWQRYILAAVLVAILAGAWLIYDQNFSRWTAPPPATRQSDVLESSTASQPAAESLPVAALPMAERANQGDAVLPAEAVQPATEPVAAQDAQPEVQSDSQPQVSQLSPAQASVAKIRLSFAAESWVSVTDRHGREIFNKIKPAGSEDSAEGEPPLNVVIGNVAGTTLIYNDKPVDLSLYDKLNVARFTLE